MSTNVNNGARLLSAAAVAAVSPTLTDATRPPRRATTHWSPAADPSRPPAPRQPLFALITVLIGTSGSAPGVLQRDVPLVTPSPLVSGGGSIRLRESGLNAKRMLSCQEADSYS